MERFTKVRGNEIQLEGPELKVGDAAPDFKLHSRGPDGFFDVKLADFKDKTLILSVVLSLDTGVCSAQTKHFNEEAGKLPEDVEVLTVSADLPYAQARYCAAEHVDKLKTASDHRDVSFGKSYGVLMSPLRVLSRAAFVVGKDGKIKHAQYVEEATSEPEYDAILAAAKE